MCGGIQILREMTANVCIFAASPPSVSNRQNSPEMCGCQTLNLHFLSVKHGVRNLYVRMQGEAPGP